MPNFTSGPDGQENLTLSLLCCLSEDSTVRFAGHFAELEQVSFSKGIGGLPLITPFLNRRSKVTLNCMPPFFQIAALMLPSRTS